MPRRFGETEDSQNADDIDAGSVDSGLVLGPDIGRSLGQEPPQIEAPPSSGGRQFGAGSGGSVQPLSYTKDPPLRAQNLSYLTLPEGSDLSPFAHAPLQPSPTDMQDTFATILYQASFGAQVSPWNTAQIISNIELMAATPEVAFVLSSPNMIDEWQASIWTNVLSAWGESMQEPGLDDPNDFAAVSLLPGATDPRRTRGPMEDWFFNHYADEFDSTERTMMFRTLAAMPRAKEQFQDLGIWDDVKDGGFWSGLTMVLKAPETYASNENDPRSQLLVQATQWLEANPIDSYEDREKFFTWFVQRAQRSIADVEALKLREDGGFNFNRLAYQLTGWVPTHALDSASDFLTKFRGPEEFFFREHLSGGQNFALSIGIDPSEGFEYRPLGAPAPVGRTTPNRTGFFGAALDQPFNLRDTIYELANSGKYEITSGSVDAFGQIYGDPNNIAYNMGLVMKAARTVPLQGSRLARLGHAINPFVASPYTRGLPVVNRTLVGRALYATLGQSVDKITDTRRAWRNWDAISEMDTPAQIARRFKNLENKEPLLKALAEETTSGGVQMLVRDAMQGGTLMGMDSPLLWSRVSAGLSSSVHNYVKKRADWLQGGGSLQGLSYGVDMIDPDDIYRVVSTTDIPVYEMTKFSSDGSKKAVVSQLGASGFARGDLNEEIGQLTRYLMDEGSEAAENAVVLLTEGGRFSQLSPEARNLIQKYGDTMGYDIMYRGGEMMPSRLGERLILFGDDKADDITSIIDDLADDVVELEQARAWYHTFRRQENPELWFIADLPDVSLTKRLRLATSNKSTSKFMRGLRKTGFRMNNTYPKNVLLTDGAMGADQTYDWIKFFGGTDELAAEWSTAFKNGNVGTREDIFYNAMKAVGSQINDPGLRHGLLKFHQKKTHFTYSFGRAGQELGLGVDKSVKPLMIAHQQLTIVMPDAKQLARTVRRSQGARGRLGALRVRKGFRGPKRLRRGIPLGKTRKNRQLLADKYEAEYRRLNNGTTDGIAPEDFVAMAYADSIGGAFGRANGLGNVSQAMAMVAAPLRGLHHVFVISQLAGRPIPWGTRFLGEETVRADQFAIPSLWRNPTKYVSRIWEEAGIRHLPERLNAMAEVADDLVAEMFVANNVNWRRLEEVIPDIRKYLDEVSVDVNDIASVRAHVSHLIGSQLEGAKVVEASIGVQGNVTRRAFRQHRKINRSLRALDRTGRLDSFRWHLDGTDIANRSFYSSVIRELESSYQPLEWQLGAMSERQVETFGHGYGRQTYQTIGDSLYGRFGFDRAISQAMGLDSLYTAEKLLNDSGWQRVAHIVDSRLKGGELENATKLRKAEWYLEQMDEAIATLFNPLATPANGTLDIQEKIRILKGLKNHGSIDVTIGNVTHTLDADFGNYEGFVRAYEGLATSAYAEGRNLPMRIAAQLDPRFGQDTDPNAFRRATDWVSTAADSVLMHVGENTTQKMHRQPAFAFLSEQRFNRLKAMGWEDDVARHAAGEYATELTNYIFFDNKNIPGFLKDMNQYIPFFSAMWEVAGTWVYKIPSVNVLPIGYLHMIRRVDRTLTGLRRSGLIDYDAESGAMTLNLDPDMMGTRDGITKSIGRTLYEYSHSPVTLLEHIGGLISLADPRGDGFVKSDFSAWSKDGHTFSIGNPLDPTSHGIMAVNQFSVGFTPGLQYFASAAANAAFAHSEERVDTPDMLVGEYMAANPDENIFELMRNNEAAFIAAQGEGGAETFKRAFQETIDIATLKMPDFVQIPKTSFWETMADQSFFPFGKIDNGFQAITAVSPSAMNYIWRALFQKLGVDDDSELMGMIFGQFSNAQVTSEIFLQLQMEEALHGSISRSAELGIQIHKIMEETGHELRTDPSGNDYVLNSDLPRAAELQALIDELTALNFRIAKTANDNAGGALFIRGLTGQISPSSPRQWTKEQAIVADYWRTRDIARESEVMGSNKYTEILKGKEISGLEDFQRIGALTSTWLEDPSGDSAKRWMLAQYPGIGQYMQGKTHWGPLGPPPEVQGFDKWWEQMESGDREFFEPEVFMHRTQRQALANDRETAIIEKYGNDPDAAVQAILDDGAGYAALVDEFDMQFEAMEFLDKYLYEGRYENFRTGSLDDLTLFGAVDRDIRERRQEADNLLQILEESNSMSDTDIARVNAAYQNTLAAANEAVERREDMVERDEIWLNPREQVMDRYYDMSDEFYKARSDYFAELETVEDSAQRGAVFDKIRILENEWYTTKRTIEGWSGDDVVVPPPLLRSWNRKTQGEKQTAILRMVAKKPEWLNLLEANILVAESPDFEKLIPDTAEEMDIYDRASREIDRIIERAKRFPVEISPYKRDLMIDEIEERRDQLLVARGRGAEIRYRDAVPLQQLAMGGILPASLAPILLQVNQVLAELRAQEKTPGTDVGRIAFLRLTSNWDRTFWPNNKQAKADYLSLSKTMFDEPLLDAAHERLLRGSSFGVLR